MAGSWASPAVFGLLLCTLLRAALAEKYELKVNLGGGRVGDFVPEQDVLQLPDETPKMRYHGEVNGPGDDLEVFKTQRFSRKEDLLLHFPVPDGVYTVTLMFAETWSKAFSEGARLFDVYVGSKPNGITRVIQSLDMFATAGGATPIRRKFKGIAAQGGITVALRPIKQNPQIAGIVFEGHTYQTTLLRDLLTVSHDPSQPLPDLSVVSRVGPVISVDPSRLYDASLDPKLRTSEGGDFSASQPATVPPSAGLAGLEATGALGSGQAAFEMPHAPASGFGSGPASAFSAPPPSPAAEPGGLIPSAPEAFAGQAGGTVTSGYGSQAALEAAAAAPAAAGFGAPFAPGPAGTAFSAPSAADANTGALNAPGPAGAVLPPPSAPDTSFGGPTAPAGAMTAFAAPSAGGAAFGAPAAGFGAASPGFGTAAPGFGAAAPGPAAPLPQLGRRRRLLQSPMASALTRRLEEINQQIAAAQHLSATGVDVGNTIPAAPSSLQPAVGGMPVTAHQTPPGPVTSEVAGQQPLAVPVSAEQQLPAVPGTAERQQPFSGHAGAGQRQFAAPAAPGQQESAARGVGGQQAFADPALAGQQPRAEFGAPGQQPFAAPAVAVQQPFSAPAAADKQLYADPAIAGQRPPAAPTFAGQQPLAAPTFAGQQSVAAPAAEARQSSVAAAHALSLSGAGYASGPGTPLSPPAPPEGQMQAPMSGLVPAPRTVSRALALSEVPAQKRRSLSVHLGAPYQSGYAGASSDVPAGMQEAPPATSGDAPTAPGLPIEVPGMTGSEGEAPPPAQQEPIAGVYRPGSPLNGICINNSTHCSCGMAAPSPSGGGECLFVVNESSAPKVCQKGHCNAQFICGCAEAAPMLCERKLARTILTQTGLNSPGRPATSHVGIVLCERIEIEEQVPILEPVLSGF
jgi:hypothetical protein